MVRFCALSSGFQVMNLEPNPALSQHLEPRTPSPTTLGHLSDVALECELAEAQTAQRELSHVGAGTSAQATAVAKPDLVLGLLGFLCNLGRRCHISTFDSLSWLG